MATFNDNPVDVQLEGFLNIELIGIGFQLQGKGKQGPVNGLCPAVKFITETGDTQLGSWREPTFFPDGVTIVLTSKFFFCSLI